LKPLWCKVTSLSIAYRKSHHRTLADCFRVQSEDVGALLICFYCSLLVYISKSVITTIYLPQ